jgi:glutamate synthase domain-containing protein 2
MRKIALWILAFVTLLAAVVTAKLVGLGMAAVVALFLPLSTLLTRDLLQTRHAIRRNFPLVGHFRYLLESIRPEINQYFIESNEDGTPFSRDLRSVVYQRAKREVDSVPFGMRRDAYEAGHEWVSHSLVPTRIDQGDMRTRIGGPRCKQPYDASVFNVSAMSYGALSKNAIEALNAGALAGGFAHNTGEGGVSLHHLKHGGDLIWQIGTGYFGCRTPEGRFSPEKYSAMASRPQIKMIELKLSQGAKPGLGGLLPAAKVTPEISAIRGVPMGVDVHSPPSHAEFSNPIELLEFITRLQDLSGGKPVGIKLCLGSVTEFMAICKAMVLTGMMPDFVTVDGAEGGTGAAPLEFTNHVGMPLEDALVRVQNCLVGFDLRRHVSVICSGRIVTGFDLVKRLAMGADACNSARAMMMALGCIQALRCNTNQCPTGVATQDPWLVRGLVVPDKAVRVANYHRETLKAARNIVEAMGVARLSELTPRHILRRTSTGEAKRCDQLYSFVEPGSFATGEMPEPYASAFEVARAESFHGEPVMRTWRAARLSG